MKLKGWGFPVFLFFYHLSFVFVTWDYSQHRMGDAYRYWHLQNQWTDYFNIGTDVVKLLNYPFSQILQLPFWFGFLLYNVIGFAAIYKLYAFSLEYINPQTKWSEWLLRLVFLLPNLHVWTSVIGKEPIVFLALTLIVVNQAKLQYFNFQYVSGWILLICIRPHAAMFALLALCIASLINRNGFSKNKIWITVFALLSSTGLYVMTMHLLNRNPLDIASILHSNKASLLAFKRADSYVPMIDYNLIERSFALNFRPIFIDSFSLYAFVLSAENFIVLILIVLSSLLYTIRYKEIPMDFFARFALLFFIISTIFYIQRYACIGIFVRTKMMYMPFLLILLVKIIAYTKPARDGCDEKAL